MTKDGTKSGQKAEMTPEEFVKNHFPENHEYAYQSLYNEMQRALQLSAAADLTSVIRGKLIKFAARHNAGEAFIISLKDVDEFLAENGFNVSNGESGC